MKTEWFTPKEITKMIGMPTTIQGVHKKAKREGWRFRRKLGVQGPAVEFCITSNEDSEQIRENVAIYQISPPQADQELQAVWLAIFHQLSEKNRALLIANILKYGIYPLLKHESQCRAAKIAAMIEMLPSAEQDLIFNWIKTNQLKHFIIQENQTIMNDDNKEVTGTVKSVKVK